MLVWEFSGRLRRGVNRRGRGVTRRCAYGAEDTLKILNFVHYTFLIGFCIFAPSK